jgi:peptide deformylase
MSLLKLIIYPDPFLTKPCKLVDSFDKELLQNVDDMFESMRFYRGIGLAANQVGIDKKIFVMDLTESKSKSMNEKQYCFINPEIEIINSEMNDFEEGCLSFPEQNVWIARPSIIKIKYFDENGNRYEDLASDLAAVCIQHEFDHINGITMHDRVNSAFEKQAILKKAQKLKKKY